jgi:hypothetical protein
MPLRLRSQSKYRNEPVHVDGYRFDSKAESHRWQELRLLEKAGEITDLRRQVPIDLTTVDQAGERQEIGHLVVDFRFVDVRSGRVRWQDTKGFLTPLAAYKLKHAKAEHGIDVELVKQR